MYRRCPGCKKYLKLLDDIDPTVTKKFKCQCCDIMLAFKENKLRVWKVKLRKRKDNL